MDCALSHESTITRSRLSIARNRKIPPHPPSRGIMEPIQECNYDGGDCCSCTCVDTTYNTCGSQYDYDCRDPNIWCKGDNGRSDDGSHSDTDDGSPSASGKDDSPSTSTSGSANSDCLESFIGDGECDAANNIEASSTWSSE